MIAVGFVLTASGARVEFQKYSEPPELAERMISVARRGPFTFVLLGRLYYRPQRQAESDAALAAALYDLGGFPALERLEGDFVLAAHDGHEGRVLALRSPTGAYPLFWLQSGETFAAATSIRALIEHLPESHRAAPLDDQSIADYLAYPIASLNELPNERTAYRDVQRLLPGWSLEMRLATRHVQRRRAWDWSAHVESPRAATIEEAGRMIRDRLQAAIRERLGRTGATACHFSGGMDSTSIGLLAETLLDARGEQLEALTHVYTADPVLATEREYLQSALEGRRALRHHAIPSDDFLRWDAFDEMPPLDEPSTGIIFHRQTAALADLARSIGADTIMGGDGADHLFSQPVPVLAAELIRRGRALHAFQVIRNHAAATMESSWSHVRQTVRALLPLRSAHARGFRAMRYTDVPAWFTHDYASRQQLAERTMRYGVRFMRGRPFGPADMEQIAGDWFNWHSGAPRGILITQPFFDTRVVSLVFGMPLHFHEAPRPMKPLLAAAMTGVLPEKILHRNRKAHFGALVEGYARNRPALEQLAQAAPESIFDRRVLLAAVESTALALYGDAMTLGRLEITLSFLKWLADRPKWLAHTPKGSLLPIAASPRWGEGAEGG